MKTHRVEFLGSFPDSPPTTGRVEIAFSGRSNVGKSSAINALLGSKKVARVSKTPGRTQAINLFAVDDALCFVDLPGYGYAKVPDAVREAWGESIEAFLRDRQALALVVVLVDIRHGAQRMDTMLLRGLQSIEVPHLVVATKADKLTRNQRQQAVGRLRRELGAPKVLAMSAHAREGIDAVWEQIDNAARRASR